MARAAPRVGFARSVSTRRPAAEDELFVMRKFSSHAAHCRHCANPYDTYMSGRELCEKGNALARDVAKYIYSRSGRPFSVIDRRHRDERIEIEVPHDCDVVHDLVRAFDRNMTLNSHDKPRVVVTQSKPHHNADRPRPTEERYTARNGTQADVIEVRPYSDRQERREREKSRDERGRSDRPSSGYYSRKGSLYEHDEEEKRRRRQSEREPVIIVVEPNRRYRRT